MTMEEIATQLALKMIEKSGVREWADEAVRSQIWEASVEGAAAILGVEIGWEDVMAVSKQLVQEMDGTPKQICFADHATDFTAPTAANDLRKTTDGSQETDVQLDMTSVANAAGRQSAKVDLGENRAELYHVRAAMEIAATPTAGATIDFYWAPSWSSSAGTGNAGAVSGSDSAYSGYSSNLTASIKQLIFIGSFVCTAQATGTIQVADVGRFSPPERYGSLVVVNNSGAAIHSDAAEINVVFDPVVPEGQ